MNQLKYTVNELVGAVLRLHPGEKDPIVKEMFLSNYNIYHHLRGGLGNAAPKKKALKLAEGVP